MRRFRRMKSMDHFVDDDTVPIGKVVKPHGLRGEVKVYPFTNLYELFKKGDVFLFNPENGWKGKVEIERARKMNKLVILKLSGYNFRDDAERIRGFEIRLEKEKLPKLGEWEYYIFQLVGCDVFYEDGSRVGKVVDVIETGSNDVIVVENDEGEEEMFPLIRDYIVELKLDDKKVIVRKIEWYEGNG